MEEEREELVDQHYDVGGNMDFRGEGQFDMKTKNIEHFKRESTLNY